MSGIKARVGQQNYIKVISSVSGLEDIVSLADLSDMNVNPSGGLQNGMVLVYNSLTQKWDATLTLTPGTTQNLEINGGSF